MKTRKAVGGAQAAGGGGQREAGLPPPPAPPPGQGLPPHPYLQGCGLPFQATVVAAFVRVGVALHPVAGRCGGHGCDGHDPPDLVVLAPARRVSFGGLAVRGTHRLGGGETVGGGGGTQTSHQQAWADSPAGTVTPRTDPTAGSQMSGSGPLAFQTGRPGKTKESRLKGKMGTCGGCQGSRSNLRLVCDLASRDLSFHI